MGSLDDIKKLEHTLHNIGAKHDCVFCRFVLIASTLLFLMAVFLFIVVQLQGRSPDGAFTVSAPQVPLVLDPQGQMPDATGTSQRIKDLYGRSLLGQAIVPNDSMEGVTMPSVLTWTPSVLGRLNADGTAMRLGGTYAIPPGWFGDIRLISDDKILGAVSVDARKLTAASKGSFVIVPIREEGSHVVHLEMDAISECRLICAPSDGMCLATNKTYCKQQAENQAFLIYSPFVAESLPLPGSCVKKTFSSIPQLISSTTPENLSCMHGSWPTDISTNGSPWLKLLGVRQADVDGLTSQLLGIANATATPKTKYFGSSGPVDWDLTIAHFSVEGQRFCAASMALEVDCP